MRKALIHFAYWILHFAGETPSAHEIILMRSLEDVRVAQDRLAAVEVRLQRLADIGDNYARVVDNPSEAGDG